MAYLKVMPVKTSSHLKNLVDYVSNENKTAGKQLVFCSDCIYETCYNDFMDVKKTYGKEGGILAHQMIQSFAVGEIDVAKAHELGKQLAERTLKGFQYTVCTHVDKDHIHNHIVFNSVNYLTGEKYYSNKKSLRQMRAVSNLIAKENKLSIIEETSGMRGIDKTTYQLANEGKSWKVGLMNDLDEVLKNAKNKSQFIAALTQKGYTVNYENKNISVQAPGEKKKIRLNTFARQFGVEYTKENIERTMRGEPINEDVFPKEKAPVLDEKDTEFIKVEKSHFSQRPVMNYQVKRKKEPDKELSIMLKLERSMKNSRTPDRFLLRGLTFFLYKNSSKERREKYNSFQEWKKQKESQPQKASDKFIILNTSKAPVTHFGNISYRELTKSVGENTTLKIPAEKAALMDTAKIFYSGLVKQNGDILVTFKSVHEDTVGRSLGLHQSMSQVKTKNEIAQERFNYKMLQLKADQRNQFVCQYKGCTREDLLALDNGQIGFSSFREKDGTYKVHFLKAELKEVCTILEKDFSKELKEFERKENTKNYAQLKENAKLEDEKICYRIVDGNLLSALRQSNLQIAYFEKGEKFNVAFLESDTVRYNKLVEELQQQIKRNISIEEQEQNKKHKR